MKYMFILLGEESKNDDSPEAMQEWADFGQKYASQIKGGEALQGVASATTLSNQNGNIVISDGPFAETKEQLGGFYIIDCKNLDEAITIGKEIPVMKYGTIEIRPVMDLSKFDE